MKTACIKYWQPGRDLTINEMMEYFQGKSYKKTIIPSKPIPAGFKIRGIVEHDYLFSWLFHYKVKDIIAAPDIPAKYQTNKTKILDTSFFIKIPKEFGDNQTAATVNLLLEILPKSPEGCKYHI